MPTRHNPLGNRPLGLALGLLIVLFAAAPPADAQSLGARRMAMGGVILSDGGEGTAQNVAYRAVPRGFGPRQVPLPLGLVQFAIDPPVFDTDDPEFNAFAIADKALNPPWNLQLIEPDPPSSDVVVEIGQNSLVVELDEMRRLFPDQRLETGGALRSPDFGLSFGPAFVSLSPLYEVSNELTLDPELHAALAEGAPVTSSRRYTARDEARAQAFLTLNAGAALPLIPPIGDLFGPDALGLFAGARVKYLRGIAYADAVNDLGFTTADTLFGDDPLQLDYRGVVRGTGDDDLFSGSGFGLDLGAVLFARGFEIGLGINDVVHEVTWQADVDTFFLDPNTNEVEKRPGPQNFDLDGDFPVSWLFTVAYRPPGWTLGASVMKERFDATVHLGAERWLGLWALRGGTFLDTRRHVQGTAGAGVRLGPVGFDLGLATHSRSLTEERGLEMGLSLALYPGGVR